jgi:hypothetical protein
MRQTAADMDRLWCIRMSLVRKYQAVESMRAAQQADISSLRAEH